MGTKRTVIDIGTNSVKILVAEVSGSRVVPLLETSEQTRLGRGFYESHELQALAIQQTAQAVARFRREAESLSVLPEDISVIATSAARDAVNQKDLLDAVHTEAGLPVRVISGDEEAEFAFQGVSTDAALHNHHLLIMDVGGGSTEFILGEQGHHTYSQSFPLGSVRLLEQFEPSDHPTDKEREACLDWLNDYFNREIVAALDTHLSGATEAGKTVELVGTGGATTILARMEHRMTDYNRDLIDGTRLARDQVSRILTHVWSLSLDERQNLVGLPPNRADIILMGAAIFLAAMNHFQFNDLYVSSRGLRFGAILG